MTKLTGTGHGTAPPTGGRPVSGHASPDACPRDHRTRVRARPAVTAVTVDTCPAVDMDMDTEPVTALVTDTEPQVVTVSVSTGPARLTTGPPDTDTAGTVTTMTMTTMSPREGRR